MTAFSIRNELEENKSRHGGDSQREFVHYGDRAMRILAEEALCRLPTIVKKEMRTPCGVIEGLVEDGDVKLCVVSIVRSGDILQEAVRQISPGVKLGKILIQRDENHVDKVPIFLYDKYPKDIDSCFVILTDPMLATGGSATLAIKMLLDKGVKEANILFLNLICAPEGLEVLKNNFPKIQVDLETMGIDTQELDNMYSMGIAVICHSYYVYT
ncbi:upp [Lepeophtheirus salmonis]|uniref:uracil phosphoribosyltransferase n=1 Tax=Lepeophtheirus salmonis TaxID=72036 RepID=A0A7R8H7V6_LEPSM|nr:upp [Lepeophtheirus salmonis]CAF2918152.1 upp [Lepeophtheirus salmonis]